MLSCEQSFKIYLEGSFEEAFSESGKENSYSPEQMAEAKDHILNCKSCLPIWAHFSKLLRKNYPDKK